MVNIPLFLAKIGGLLKNKQNFFYFLLDYKKNNINLEWVCPVQVGPGNVDGVGFATGSWPAAGPAQLGPPVCGQHGGCWSSAASRAPVSLRRSTESWVVSVKLKTRVFFN
jgi:hypothetical protein